MTRAGASVAALLALAVLSGCNSNDEPTTPTPTTGSSANVIVFAGTVAPAGSQIFSFTIAGGVPLRVSLGSLTDANAQPLPQSLRLTFGIPQGTGCSALQTVITPATLATQLSAMLSPGTYCVSVTDIGQLGTTASFGVRLVFGDPRSDDGGGTITYTSTVLQGGFTSRTFDATQAGTAVVLFDTIEPGSVSSLSLGIGFPRTDGGGCQITQLHTATRGSQFAVNVEAGTYCVRVADVGTVTGSATFTLRIQHP
jgi:hypothetical protein